MPDKFPPLQSAEIGGAALAWREAGRGPALVLVHGIGGYSASWRPQLDALQDAFRVIAWDAPGYGGSALRSPRPHADDYAAALLALLDRLGIGAAHLVGHSLGAVFVAALCRLRPGLAQRVVFLHPVTGTGSLPPEQRDTVRNGRINDLKSLGMRGFAANRGRAILGSLGSPDALAEAIAVMADVPEAGYLAAWEAMCAADIFPDLGHVRGPALVVCGSADPVSPPATGERIAAALPDATFAVIDGLGHYGSLEVPDQVNRMLRDFLAS